MSTNTPDSVQTPENSVPENKQETANNPDAVLAKNRELLAEKKGLSAKLADYESKMQVINDAKLEAEGKKDDVIASLRKQLGEANDSSAKKDKAYNWNTVSSQIKEAAIKKGCTSPDKLLKLMSDKDWKAIQVYDDYSVNSDDLNSVLEGAMKEHADIGLFKAKVKVDDMVPTNGVQTKQPKSLSELSKEEILAKLHE